MHLFSYGLCLLLLPLSLSAAVPSEAELQTTLRSLNTWSPVESAAAHGITGFRIGTGVSSFSIPESSQAAFEDETQHQKTGRVLFPKILVTKGLWYPFDIGLVYGRLQDTNISQFGGYTQWTVFEALAMPALALRGTYSQIMGLQGGALESGGLQAIASWGVPFVTGFVSYGTTYNQGTLPAPDRTSSAKTQTWWQPEASIGFNLTLLPPFIVVGVEAASLLGAENNLVLQAKVSMGL